MGMERICPDCKYKKRNGYITKHSIYPAILVKKRTHEKRISEMTVKEYAEYIIDTHNDRATTKGFHDHRCELTFEEWIHILYLQGGKCRACGNGFDLENIATLDHIIPISKGGDTIFTNVQALCKKCNSIKHCKDNSKFLNEFLQNSN
jgi:5-methylcytosine-specific restriction endonuclease McrA